MVFTSGAGISLSNPIKCIIIDSLNFSRDVTSILIKVMPSSKTIVRAGYQTDWVSIPNREIHKGIEINSYATIKREIDTQKEIYRKSIIIK